jgi:hypothetical protein
MHRIDADAHVGNQFSDGNPATGQPGTRVDAAWLNAVQEEIAGVVEASGAELSKGINNQLAQSVSAAVLHWAAGSLAQTAIQSLFAWGAAGASGSQAPGGASTQIMVPHGGRISGFRVRLSSPSDVGQIVFSLYKNGVSSDVSALVVLGDSSGVSAESVLVDAGDVLEVRAQQIGPPVGVSGAIQAACILTLA